MSCRTAALALLLGVLAAPAVAQQAVVIQSTTLIDGRTGLPTDDVTIVIEGDHIKAVGQREALQIPSDATVIDGRGKWVIPGLVDVHAHFTMRDRLRQALALGITTVHVMPLPPDNRRELELWARKPQNAAPRLQLTTPLFTGGFPDNIMPGLFAVNTPKEPSDAREAVQELWEQDFRQVKIIQDDGVLWTGPERAAPRLSDPVFAELVDRAHTLGMRVYVHVTQLRDSRQAILARVDAFMHGTMDSPLEDSLWRAMRQSGTVWTPAMAVVLAYGDTGAFARRILSDRHLREVLSEEESARHTADVESTAPPENSPMVAVPPNLARYMSTLQENTRQAQSFGIPIAVGSDGGPGVMTHIEMELLAEAGLTTSEVLIAATYGGALALGMQNEIGTVEPGKLADIALLRANPLADIRNARNVECTIKGGWIFKKQSLLQ